MPRDTVPSFREGTEGFAVADNEFRVVTAYGLCCQQFLWDLGKAFN